MGKLGNKDTVSACQLLTWESVYIACVLYISFVGVVLLPFLWIVFYAHVHVFSCMYVLYSGHSVLQQPFSILGC